MTLLRRWWTKKYRLPITSEHWKESFFEDLYVEFFEDLLFEDEDFARVQRLKYLGVEVITGDDLLDLWERQIAQGQVPDMDVGEDEKAKERDRKVREAARKHKEQTGQTIYKAKLHPAIDYMEAVREGLDPYELTAGKEEQLAEMEEAFHVQYDVFSDRGIDRRSAPKDFQEIPREAFDAFVNASKKLK